MDLKLEQRGEGGIDKFRKFYFWVLKKLRLDIVVVPVTLEEVANASPNSDEGRYVDFKASSKLLNSIACIDNTHSEHIPSHKVLKKGDSINIGHENIVLVSTLMETYFILRSQDLIGGVIIKGEEWEPHVRLAIQKSANMQGVAVDVGAYIGLHAVTMSRNFRQVHAFEPQSSIFQLLNGNLVLNDCVNVITHNHALYDHNCLMRLAPQERQEVAVPMQGEDPDYARISNAAALTFEPDIEGSVKGLTMDSINLTSVALIKIDAQGADLNVLRGARETIKRDRPVVLFEWERDLGQQHGSTMDDFLIFFDELNYSVSIINDTSPGRQADYIAVSR